MRACVSGCEALERGVLASGVTTGARLAGVVSVVRCELGLAKNGAVGESE